MVTNEEAKPDGPGVAWAAHRSRTIPNRGKELIVTTDLETVIYPVKDLAQAKELYGKLLGCAPAHDAPYYVQFDVGGRQVGLDPQGHSKGMTGPIGYWQVADIKETLQQLVASGAAIKQEPRDVGGGKLIATVADADGNVTGLTQNP
jgi:predicted enzyme related to lactoylglutathione lyase